MDEVVRAACIHTSGQWLSNSSTGPRVCSSISSALSIVVAAHTARMRRSCIAAGGDRSSLCCYGTSEAGTTIPSQTKQFPRRWWITRFICPQLHLVHAAPGTRAGTTVSTQTRAHAPLQASGTPVVHTALLVCEQPLVAPLVRGAAGAASCTAPAWARDAAGPRALQPPSRAWQSVALHGGLAALGACAAAGAGVLGRLVHRRHW